jgi:hypothetical protein
MTEPRRERDPRRFIETLTRMGVEVVIEPPRPRGKRLVFPPRVRPDAHQLDAAVRLLVRALPHAVMAQVQRILDSEARRLLKDRMRPKSRNS